MQILLTGATGFIGRHIATRLRADGHTVHEGVSPRHGAARSGQVPMDFARDTAVAAWLPRLSGIDAVVNAVGVLRDSPARPIDALHRDTPRALFQACAQAGVRRVVQISALGVDRSETRYARTKRAADDFLLGLSGRPATATTPSLAACVLRPSIVFGRGGACSPWRCRIWRTPWRRCSARPSRAKASSNARGPRRFPWPGSSPACDRSAGTGPRTWRCCRTC